ncbi:OmpA family protein [Hwanghaeella grinnelliae]|uniref:OmpA family protein n=1 Tax=Hwanghaeella grinnelliae TaxID=2500179 RepID=A0A437QUP7_9PROT|nr:OmpA family protein [Hwanghaeella grinnelliae]RVU38156.1 OmpA family protein [Hwanghaeella grinnelliae]
MKVLETRRNPIQQRLGPAFVVAAFVLLIFWSPAQAQGVVQDPSVEDLIRQLKPAEGQAKPVFRSLGAATRGIQVELPGGSGDSADQPAAPTVNLSIEFDFNSHTLTPKGKQALSTLGEALVSNELEEFHFLVAGHTDAVGGDDYNMILSELRARSVRDFLVGTYGIKSDRLVAQGYGETRLLKPDQPDAGENRRVQITNLGAED